MDQAEIGLELPPAIRRQVEALVANLGLANFGSVTVEFELERGRLTGTFLKLGRIKNQELERVALALSRLR